MSPQADGMHWLCVVRYRNKPTYKGVDEFLVIPDSFDYLASQEPVTTHSLERAYKFVSETQAGDSVKRFPHKDDAHDHAEVVMVKMVRKTLVTYELMPNQNQRSDKHCDGEK